MGKMKKKRSISKLKANNHKRNKLVKKGKLKPSGGQGDPWIKAQREKAQLIKQKKARVKHQVEVEHQNEVQDEDDDGDEDELMDVEDAMMLGSMEMKRMKRLAEDKMIHEESNTEKRFLLPTKGKDGKIIVNSVDVEKMDPDEEEEEDDDESEAEGHKGHEVRDQEPPPEPKTMLGLLAERETSIHELKLSIGTLASNFLEHPEERTLNLEKLVKMTSPTASGSGSAGTKVVGFKYAAITVTELLKDVLPNYKINHHNNNNNQENVLQKKETLKLQSYENFLLNSAKNFLKNMEKALGDKKLSLQALTCLCDLLTSNPAFNYAVNVVSLVVPYLDHNRDEYRGVTQNAVKTLFKDDKKGEISLWAVRKIRALIKRKGFRNHSECVDCFLGLRLGYIEKNDDNDDEGKRKRHKKQFVSKKDKKRQKQLAKIEKEMLESKGEEDRNLRNKNFSEVAKVVFETLFRIIKSINVNDETASMRKKPLRLLSPTLKCLSEFCHVINVEFFHDLLNVLDEIAGDERIEPELRIRCVETAFHVLTGPGDCLTYDHGNLAKTLLRLLPALRSEEAITAACNVVHAAVVKRKKRVSKNLVLSVGSALVKSAVSLQKENPDSARICLDALKSVRIAHSATIAAAFDDDDGDEGYTPPEAKGLNLLNTHFSSDDKKYVLGL